MRMTGSIKAIAGLMVLAAIAWGAIALTSTSAAYTVTGVLPEGNPNLNVGSPIYVNGFEKGEIDSITAKHNQAVITVSLDDDVAPLHDGARMHTQWRALVGERLLFIEDGPAANPEIPNGSTLPGSFPEPTEVSDVLAALDPQTRQHLGTLIGRLKSTLDGREQDARSTVQAAGPALESIGNVLRGVGSDGPAIRALVDNLNAMMAKLNNRSPQVQSIVDGLTRSTEATAEQRQALSIALQKLPGTLDIARSTLADVPDTTNAAVPLLQDLRTATERLPSVAHNLKPVLVDLRPTIAELKPTLQSASQLLQYTPQLLQSGNAALPDLGETARSYLPTLAALRPYTPEAVGFLTSWGSAAQNYDANGRYMRIFAQGGGSSFDANPGLMPPGVTQEKTPAPGQAASLAGADGEGMN